MAEEALPRQLVSRAQGGAVAGERTAREVGRAVEKRGKGKKEERKRKFRSFLLTKTR